MVDRPMGVPPDRDPPEFPRPMGVFTPGHTNVPGSPYPATMACGCGAEFHTVGGHTSKGQLERHQLWCRGVPYNPLHVLTAVMKKLWVWCQGCGDATEHWVDGTVPGDVVCSKCSLVQFTFHAPNHEGCRPECTTVQERTGRKP